MTKEVQAKKVAPWGLIIISSLIFFAGFSAIGGIRTGDSFFTLETIIRLTIGVFYIVLSVGIAKLKKWGYWGFIVSSVVSIIFLFFEIFVLSLTYFSCSNVRSFPVGGDSLSFEVSVCPDVKMYLILWTIPLIITLLATFYVYRKRSLFAPEEKK